MQVLQTGLLQNLQGRTTLVFVLAEGFGSLWDESEQENEARDLRLVQCLV